MVCHCHCRDRAHNRATMERTMTLTSGQYGINHIKGSQSQSPTRFYHKAPANRQPPSHSGNAFGSPFRPFHFPCGLALLRRASYPSVPPTRVCVSVEGNAVAVLDLRLRGLWVLGLAQVRQAWGSGSVGDAKQDTATLRHQRDAGIKGRGQCRTAHRLAGTAAAR
jgi:hypothetical protein